MSVLVGKNSKIIVQGIIKRWVPSYPANDIDYGSNVAGVQLRKINKHI